MGLRFLHLSDIHFKTFDGFKFNDLDTDIRNELEIDLKKLRERDGCVDFILVGGDIAFSGSKEEYEVAGDWLKKIAEIAGCKQEDVLTVPGNHDVERSKITRLHQETQADFKKLNRKAIDRKLEGYLTSSDMLYLLTPFENYHSFALKFGSIPEKGNLLYWEKLFQLDKHRLRVRGVNSAIVSNNGDNEDDAKLVLGAHQSLMPREEGVINVILCHHPPSWLCDGEEAIGDFESRAKIHLFGHKHKFEAEMTDSGCLVLAAGAMQPERTGSDWEPTYNIIDLSIQKDGLAENLVVNVYRRIWDTNFRRFGPDINECDKHIKTYKIALQDLEIKVEEPKKVESDPNLTEETMPDKVINKDIPNHVRRLAYLFLGLPYDRRLKVAMKLGLVEKSDEDLNDILKAQQYFKRATEKDLLAKLWDLVMENLGENQPNPFKK